MKRSGLLRSSTFGLGAVAVTAALGAGGGGSLQPTGTGGPCVGVLDGAKFPSAVPAVFTWSHVLDIVHTGESHRAFSDLAGATGLSAEAIAALQSAVAPAVEAARAVGAANEAAGTITPRRDTGTESRAAPVMEARDTVLRAVPEVTALALEEWANIHANQRAFVIDVPGRLIPHWDGSTRCSVTVNGREHFSLIPEGFVWEYYFRVRARVAAAAIADYGRAAYLQTLQTDRLSIPLREVEQVVEVSTATLLELDVLRARPDDEAQRLAVASVVMAARTRLLRTLSPASWKAVLADVRLTAGGTVFDLPTGI